MWIWLRVVIFCSLQGWQSGLEEMLCLDVICWEVLNCGYSPGLLRDDIWLSMAVLKSLEIHSFLGYEQDLASNRKSYAKNQAKGLTAQHSSRNPKNHPQWYGPCLQLHMQLASNPCHVWCHVALQCWWPGKKENMVLLRDGAVSMGQTLVHGGYEEHTHTLCIYIYIIHTHIYMYRYIYIYILMGMLAGRLFWFGHVCCLERSVANFGCERQMNVCGCLAGEHILLMIPPPKLPMHSIFP